MERRKPIVYSCSGCSSVAQMSNYLALQLDRKGIAEMSCIVGVGGNVKKLVHQAKSGRKLIAIDGCPLACCKACLQNHDLAPDMYYQLTDWGISKRQGEDYDLQEAQQVLSGIQDSLKDKFPNYDK